MTMIVRDGTNTPRTITAIQVRDGTNTPRDISEMWVRDSNNVSRLVFSLTSPFSVSAAPVTRFGKANGTGTATTPAATVSVVGGTAPYSYSWQLIGYDNTVPPTADSPTSASSTFTQTNIDPGDFYTAFFNCVVTDSTTPTPFIATTNEITASWTDISL